MRSRTVEDDQDATAQPTARVSSSQSHRLERLKARTGIPAVCADMLRHTWATNFHRSGSGSKLDMQDEGGWTTGRMVERYCKARPFEERRKAPSGFSASRAAKSTKRPSEKVALT